MPMPVFVMCYKGDPLRVTLHAVGPACDRGGVQARVEVDKLTIQRVPEHGG
jgi:hypothetical protein